MKKLCAAILLIALTANVGFAAAADSG